MASSVEVANDCKVGQIADDVEVIGFADKGALRLGAAIADGGRRVAEGIAENLLHIVPVFAEVLQFLAIFFQRLEGDDLLEVFFRSHTGLLVDG